MRNTHNYQYSQEPFDSNIDLEAVEYVRTINTTNTKSWLGTTFMGYVVAWLIIGILVFKPETRVLLPDLTAWNYSTFGHNLFLCTITYMFIMHPFKIRKTYKHYKGLPSLSDSEIKEKFPDEFERVKRRLMERYGLIPPRPCMCEYCY